MIGPAHCDAASIRCDLKRQASGGVHDESQWARPAGFGESIKIVGQFAGKNGSLVEGIYEDGEGASFKASLDAKNLVDCGEINGVGGEGVERVGWNGDN
jgi:hypothetical protein